MVRGRAWRTPTQTVTSKVTALKKRAKIRARGVSSLETGSRASWVPSRLRHQSSSILVSTGKIVGTLVISSQFTTRSKSWTQCCSLATHSWSCWMKSYQHHCGSSACRNVAFTHAAANANNNADVYLQSLCVAQYALISFKHMGETQADKKFDNLTNCIMWHCTENDCTKRQQQIK